MKGAIYPVDRSLAGHVPCRRSWKRPLITIDADFGGAKNLVGPSDEMLGTVRRGMHPSPAYLDRCGMPEVPDD